MNKLKTGLYIVSTPIGNLEDITLRAKKVLSLVDYIVCENPNHSLKLLNKLGIKKKLFALHDYNEKKLIKNIENYQKNSSIALISDAGSPLISDPGFNLLQDYIKKNIFITVVPGPSSVIAGLQLAGLAIHDFRFCGFVPKNKTSINLVVKEIDKFTSTSIHFISGNRLILFIQSLIDNKITRPIAVCKEISKSNEKIFRGLAKDINTEILKDEKNLKGEFVVIIEGSAKNNNREIDNKIELQIKKLLKKFSLTEVVQIVHILTNISKREIYKRALNLKND
tara:strand:+ start:705 stop:1547 length:843 start_codon:yes stop_codon:yes gene_type:complete